MRPKVLVDFHHSSLLRSLVMLFEDRLDISLYRPIGMEWFTSGYWAINDQEATAKQYLSLGQVPKDGTVPLNDALDNEDGVYYCADPGDETFNKACTFDYFTKHQFDYIVASIPAHVPLFQSLIERYQPHAKLIIQMGNNWNLAEYVGHNVLASIKPEAHPGVNAHFYHQEFDTEIFYPSKIWPSRKVYSFVNCIEEIDHGSAWIDYQLLRDREKGYKFKAFGGQCPDGNMTGPRELANKMRAAEYIFHVKPGGDGFGHIIHNAYSVGRPVITRSSYYKGQLAEDLLVEGTFVDLDEAGATLSRSTDEITLMGAKAAERFKEVVDYKREAKGIEAWLNAL